MKRTLAFVFAMLLLLTCIPVSRVNALTDGYFIYTVSNGKATITDSNDAISGAITIPSTLGGYPVTAIGDWAFSHNNKITSVKIPEGITTIGRGVFSNCANLTTANVPDSVTAMDPQVFEYCPKLTGVSLGKGLTEIPMWTFRYCTGLTGFVIPEQVITLRDAFTGCSNLKKITIPAGLQRVSTSAFEYCSSLTDVYFGGTEAQRNQMSIGLFNTPFENATWHYSVSPLKIKYQPSSVTVKKGETASVGVSAVGDGLTYQWYVKDSGTRFVRDYEQSDRIYRAVMDGTVKSRQVYCVVKDKYGNTATSDTATITVLIPITVSGKVSCADTEGSVTLKMIRNGSVAYVTTTDTDTFEFGDVTPGNYTLEVSKDNHVTRTYSITVSQTGGYQDVEICLIGDVTADQKVNLKDWCVLYNHVSAVKLLEGYALKCADVNGDSKVNMKDWCLLYNSISEAE